tara:strand:- start:189 stop:374 length:186 start_codon:yes stop_codon:yes gene_type:complete
MRPVDPKLMEILVCPISKKELVQKGDELICIESQLAYPIKNGIPIMIPEEARKLNAEEQVD